MPRRAFRLPYDAFRRDLLLFHEYFDGETGRGLGASHQTGWTAMVIRLFGTGASQTDLAVSTGNEGVRISRFAPTHP
ncbi:MAG: hypothetical protein KatS3mg104_2788 [Phycisphaerae bacterium]|nr:MAG: hypothetical protein KatS3mg104_2788 [Phycisphaerae bacterium]